MSKARLPGDPDMLAGLQKQPEKAISQMYQMYKSTFMGFIRKIGGEESVHLEVYHDSLLAFYDIWLEGKYDATRASISTLLCAIGRNKLLTRLGKQKRTVEWTELAGMADIRDDPEPEDPGLLLQVEQALAKLGEGCQEIIVLFYYQQMNLVDIAERLNYKNDNVVKAHKSRCMKRLKEMIQSTDS